MRRGSAPRAGFYATRTRAARYNSGMQETPSPDSPSPNSSFPNAEPRRRVVLATSNPGKVRELQGALSGLPWELVPLNDPSLPPLTLPAETGATYEENAALKACAAALATGLPALADDSGLEVEALHGAPGIYSARYGTPSSTVSGTPPGKVKSDLERNLYLLEQLRGQTDRRARFVSVLLLAYPDGQLETYRGELEGQLLEGPRGQGGFGYDPLFVLPDGRSLAELSTAEKRQVSHRGRAVAQLLAAHASGSHIPLADPPMTLP